MVGKAGERWVCRPIGGRYIGAGDGPPPASTGRKRSGKKPTHNDRRRAELGQEHAPLPLAIGQRHEPEQPDDHHNGDGVTKSARDPITQHLPLPASWFLARLLLRTNRVYRKMWCSRRRSGSWSDRSPVAKDHADPGRSRRGARRRRCGASSSAPRSGPTAPSRWRSGSPGGQGRSMPVWLDCRRTRRTTRPAPSFVAVVRCRVLIPAAGTLPGPTPKDRSAVVDRGGVIATTRPGSAASSQASTPTA